MSDFKENTKEIINKEGRTGSLNFMRDGENKTVVQIHSVHHSK